MAEPSARRRRRIDPPQSLYGRIALLDDDARRLAPALADGRPDLRPDALGDAQIGLGVGAVGHRHHDGLPAVGGLADRHVEGELAEELGAEPLRLAARAAMAEDVAALAAMGAEEIAHVLDDAEDRHVDFAEHVEPLARVEERYVL